MTPNLKYALVFCLAALIPASAFAQSEPGREQVKYYRLDFFVKEVSDTKILNILSYSMLASTSQTSGRPTSIRTGSRVPSPTSPGSSQFQYMEVGVNIDCGVLKEIENQIALHVTAEVSSMPATGEVPSSLPPILRQVKWSSEVLVPIRKATLLFSSDDPSTKRRLQLELTASPLK